VTKRSGAIAALAMLKQDRLDVRVFRQQRNEFRAAVAAEANNSDGGQRHWMISVCHGPVFRSITRKRGQAPLSRPLDWNSELRPVPFF